MHTSIHPPAAPRSAGVLLHPTSLPGRYGIGDLGDELIVFLDWAASAGFRVWQVLPLNPPGYGESPYGALSAFAGNPLLISPQRLLSENLLTAEAVAEVPVFPDDWVDFEPVRELKFALLRASWTQFNAEAGDELRAAFDAFVAAEQEWLDDYAIFMTLKDQHGGKPWWMWDRDARPLPGQIEFWKYVQFLFFRQWETVREAARARGIQIMGDVPIYVAADSADVWGNQELFQLDADGNPTVVAGVPPDYFSETGQRWGNPLYRWDVLRESGFRWWINRVRTNLRFADILRLDHFRGFEAYWEIPASEPTAVHGRWMPGPGLALFEALREALGGLPLVAEDLGFITEPVDALRRAVGLPGMKVLQFGFATDSVHIPHRYDRDTVVYTGTHDNDTVIGWYSSAPEDEQERARVYLGSCDERIATDMIRAAYTSVAQLAIVPVQDVLALGTEARMNQPGAPHGNWSWRLTLGALTRAQAMEMRKLAEATERM